MRININKKNLLDIINIKFKVFDPIDSFMSNEDFFLISFAAFLGIVPFVESFSAIRHSISNQIENLFSKDQIFSISGREYLGIIISL